MQRSCHHSHRPSQHQGSVIDRVLIGSSGLLLIFIALINEIVKTGATG